MKGEVTYTPAELAEALKVSTATVARWRHQGQIPVIELPGGHFRISAATYERLTKGEDPQSSGPQVPLKDRPWLLVAEAMLYMRMSREEINRLIKEGELKTFKEGKREKIITESIADYAKRQADAHRRAS